MDLVSKTGGGMAKGGILTTVDGYEKYHTQYGGDAEKRKASYTDMVNKYYDLVTGFYEYGWGESFHFAHRLHGESLRESIKRHEHFLALNMEMKPGQKFLLKRDGFDQRFLMMFVLDVGCGIGGPLREIAAFSGALVTGLNNNEFQIARGKTENSANCYVWGTYFYHDLNRKAGLDNHCEYMKADFMSIPALDNTFDAAYAIEATCHAPDPVACYAEIKRVLKPGQYFAAYEWVLTEAYDAENEEHRTIKADIEIGNGLPDIRSGRQITAALVKAGFEVIRVEDLTKTAQLPWYLPLDPDHFSLSSFRLTKVGRCITRIMVKVLETLRIAPPGSVRVSNFLETSADGLVKGGKKEIFSPLLFFLVRKPMN